MSVIGATCLLRALYTLKNHVSVIVRKCLLWGRYLADALASVTSDVDPLEGMEDRIVIPFDEVLKLTLIIDRVESMPYIKVIKQSERSVTLKEIRLRTPASIELDEAIRLIRERGETIIHHATMMHIGSLNDMYTSLAELRGELTVLGVRCLELISGTDHDRDVLFSRVEISLTVQLPQRKYLTFKMSYADRIIDIKLKIMREVGIPCADFYLTVADRSLDDDKTLVESRLLPGSNLYLRLRLSGGVRGGTHDAIPNPEMYDEDEDLILSEINLERLNQQFQPIADNSVPSIL